MSKITDWFVEKMGVDKALHFLGGAWITALCSAFGWYGIIAGIFITFVLSFVKEQWLDSEFDKVDIQAAMIGSAVSAVCYGILWGLSLLC